MSGKAVAAVIISLVAGGAAGALIPSLLKPKITISPNPVTAGTLVTFTYTGFPPNTGLMSMGGGTQNIAGSGPIVIGQTDQNGSLQIIGTAPNLPSGIKILYVVFATADPSIFATAIYQQA
jgi:hypothetical protein